MSQRHAAALQNSLLPNQAVLISTPSDIAYFTGFECLLASEREAFVLITPTKVTLLKATFSPLPTEVFFAVHNNVQPAALAEHLKNIFNEQSQINELLIDESNLFVNEYHEILNKLHDTHSITPVDKAKIWNLRTVKDDDEVTVLEKAGQIVQKVMTSAPHHFQIGITERQICHILESELRQIGAEMPSFPTIVAFGPHAAEPHYQPGDTPLTNGTVVLIDMGAQYHHYCSDMTRVFWFGTEQTKTSTPFQKFQKIEKIVQDAYQAAVDFVTQAQKNAEKITAKMIDAVAREVIVKAGYSKEFIHTTGHGIGIDLHEPPSLNWQNAQPITTGMTFTIEPGVYFRNEFGYRYENTLLLTADGVRSLT